MVKQNKKVNKSKMRKHKSKSSKSKTTNKNKSRKMKGGDGSGGRVALPPAYFNSSSSGLNGYFAPGSSELNSVGKQLAVSQGTISGDGGSAGPNLFPMHIGGGCGCNKKQKKNKNKTSSKSRKMKNKKTKKVSKK